VTSDMPAGARFITCDHFRSTPRPPASRRRPKSPPRTQKNIFPVGPVERHRGGPCIYSSFNFVEQFGVLPALQGAEAEAERPETTVKPPI